MRLTAACLLIALPEVILVAVCGRLAFIIVSTEILLHIGLPVAVA